MTDETKRPGEEQAPDTSAPPAAEPQSEDTSPQEGGTRPTPPEEAATQVMTPEEAATQVVPPEEAATRVMPPKEAATRVMPETPTAVKPATGTPGSPPPSAPLGRSVPPPGGRGRDRRLWLVALAAAAVVAVIVVWAVALRDTGERFVGTWAPADGSGGGLVVSLRDGRFTVSMYDEGLELLGTYPAARDGDVLTYRFTDTRSGRGLMKATLTHDEDLDVLTLRLTGPSSEGVAIDYVRVDALSAASPTPTPAASAVPVPTVSATGTASPTASPTGSPSPSPSPTTTDTAALDRQVIDGLTAINNGIVAWSAANGGVYPTTDQVTATGAVAGYVSTWPTNPYTGRPMSPGTGTGDYTYEQLDGGRRYRLTGYLSSGTFTIP
ncbi:MAG TPA: hypothetical protein PLK79_04895 [Thermoleophilia bacterium]|nr:hypothetical protein [Thermoleophilia bacterium]HQG03309.1 hypothetical protein [Thermoleophilia bacterium]